MDDSIKFIGGALFASNILGEDNDYKVNTSSIWKKRKLGMHNNRMPRKRIVKRHTIRNWLIGV